MFIIVNADDLGRSKKVNDAIFDLMKRKRVTSASLLANGPSVEEAIKRSIDYPNCSFGIHLNLMEFRPLSSGKGLSEITDHEGQFKGNLFNVSISKSLLNAIYYEWFAQVEKLLLNKVPISHIDSHFHTHTIPKLFLVLKRIQKTFGIRKVRITKNLYSDEQAISSKYLLLKKWVWNTALRHFYGTVTTQIFSDFTSFIEILKGGKKLRFRTGELMVHPGMEEFSEETQLLAADWEAIAKTKVIFINYRCL